MSEEKTKNIFEKLHSVTENVGKIYKEQNKGMPYKSVNHNAVTQAVRKEIIKERLFVKPIIDENINQGTMHKIVMSVEIIDIDNPADKIEIGKFPALGLDNQDKGYGKAISYAFKYILQKTFMMEIGDDEEVDAHNINQENTEIDYSKKGSPYRYFATDGSIKGDTTDIKEWSKRIYGLTKHENISALKPYIKEMKRVQIELDNEPNSELHNQIFKTIENARELINE